MSYDWYPWFPIKYRRATLGLSLAECGAYRRLIDEYMVTAKPLPDDDRALARLIGCTLDEWHEVAPKVRPFFEHSHGKLVQDECETRLNAQSMRQASRTAKAQTAAFARWNKNNNLNATSNAQAMPGAMLGDAILNKNRYSSSLPSSRASPKPTPQLTALLERQGAIPKQNGNATPRSLASALPAGALAHGAPIKTANGKHIPAEPTYPTVTADDESEIPF